MGHRHAMMTLHLLGNPHWHTRKTKTALSLFLGKELNSLRVKVEVLSEKQTVH